jgi:hypothetical protein
MIEYTLGHRGPSNKKADLGTIAHKVLEICGACKKSVQENKDFVDDDLIGKIETNNPDEAYINDITQKVYDYYTTRIKHHEWEKRDFKFVSDSVWKALKYNQGIFDPRNLDIIDVEPHFDFEIKHDWAKFDYPQYNLKGNLSLKGTIDLITKINDDVYEVTDYKTGRRLDWATGEVKTQASLFHDPQLRIYHYAVKQMYPHVHTFIITIFFINDGGAFTLHFTDDDIPETERMIREKFEKIRDTEDPKIIRQIDPKQGWKCKKLCNAGMNSFDEKTTGIKPVSENRSGQYMKYGSTLTMCEQVRYAIKVKGIDWVIENYTHPDHTHGFYQIPGEVGK